MIYYLLCNSWLRPTDICESPEYFQPGNPIAAMQGTLPDEVFLGTLMALCAYPKLDLVDNIFASRPSDFKRYGVYTCRFYVEGQWEEVFVF